MKITRVIFSIVLGMALIPLAYGEEIERCQICGMDVSKYTHVKYVVTTTDGKAYTTCCCSGSKLGLPL